MTRHYQGNLFWRPGLNDYGARIGVLVDREDMPKTAGKRKIRSTFGMRETFPYPSHNYMSFKMEFRTDSHAS